MARFLFIEPHADIRLLYQAVVQGMGHEAVFFGGGSIDEPDVIVVEPADAESFEAARQLRRDRPGVPIVCASIYEPTLVEAQVLEPTGYLLKPFSLVELTAALQLALSQCRLEGND